MSVSNSSLSSAAGTAPSDWLIAKGQPAFFQTVLTTEVADVQSSGRFAFVLDMLGRPSAEAVVGAKPVGYTDVEQEEHDCSGEREDAQVAEGAGSINVVRGVSPPTGARSGVVAAANNVKPGNNIIGTRWQEYHGCNEWQGLLEPLDDALRREIVKYGNFAQLCYNAFDFDDNSTNCGNCLHSQETLFRETGFNLTGYQVTNYLYAMSDVHVPKWLKISLHRSEAWSKDSNWMGFVAVATDEEEVARLGRRDIVVAWRGTVTFLEWLEDVDGDLAAIRADEYSGRLVDEDLYRFVAAANIRPSSDEEDDHRAPERKSPAAAVVIPHADIIGVERGFWTLYTSRNEKTRYNSKSAAQQMREALRRLVEKYAGEELSITVTGHSLGGALALLSAFDVAASGINRNIPVSVISFAAPKVGNEAFKRKLKEVGVNVLRIVNVNDIVPKVPGLLATIIDELAARMEERVVGRVLHEGLRKWGYSHAGSELRLNNRHSPYLKKTWNLADFHNLEVYLHLVDAYRSAKEPFVEELRSRDLALINKSTALLVEEVHVPAVWLHQQKVGHQEAVSWQHNIIGELVMVAIVAIRVLNFIKPSHTRCN